jgi:hypothetical protein
LESESASNLPDGVLDGPPGSAFDRGCIPQLSTFYFKNHSKPAAGFALSACEGEAKQWQQHL